MEGFGREGQGADRENFVPPVVQRGLDLLFSLREKVQSLALLVHSSRLHLKSVVVLHPKSMSLLHQKRQGLTTELRLRLTNRWR